jgi:diacylglycerol kinase family enzyme
MSGSLVIVNPNASKVRDDAARGRLKQQLDEVLKRRDGSAPHIVETASQGDTRPLVEAALADDVRSIVGVGGDGTMRDIAASLTESSVPLGLVPAGTGNQVAAVLGIPLSLEGAVAALATEHTTTIDLGEVTLRPVDGAESTSTFIIGCGAGFDAHLMATTPAGLKRKFGKTAYLAQAIRLGLGIKALPSVITVDDEVIEMDSSIALVGNMGQLIPGVMDLRMPIDPSDGQFDIIVVAAHGPIHGLKGLVDQLRRRDLGGGSGSDSIRRRGQSVTIETQRPAPLEVDGDYVGEGGLSACILPGALDVLVPRAS